MIQSLFLLEWDDFIFDYFLANSSNIQNSIFVKNPKFIVFYPQKIDAFNNLYTINRILEPHKADIEQYYNNQNKYSDLYKNPFKYLKKTHIVAQEIYDQVLITVYIIPNRVLGLIFDQIDDPSIYMEELEADLELFIYLNLDKFNKSKDSFLETTLYSIFIDMRNVYYSSTEDIIHIIEPNIIRSQLEEYYKNKFIKLYIFGLDNAGKSSLMRFIKTGKFDHNFFLPTKKFEFHKLILPNNAKVICWEMPGQKLYRKTWIRALKGSDLLIFVLDAADKNRFLEAKEVFWSIALHQDVIDKPVIFIANKIDLVENRKDLNEIEDFFNLKDLSNRNWTIKFISLVTKEGISDLIKKISENLEENIMNSIFEELNK